MNIIERIKLFFFNLQIRYIVLFFSMVGVIGVSFSLAYFSNSVTQPKNTFQSKNSESFVPTMVVQNTVSSSSPTLTPYVSKSPYVSVPTPSPVYISLTPIPTSIPPSNQNTSSNTQSSVTATYTPTPVQSEPTPTSSPSFQTAELYFSPQTMLVQAGQQFTTQVKVDTGGQEVNAVEIIISYPVALLELVTVDGSISDFSFALPTSNGNGSITIQRGSVSPVSGDLLIVGITFRAVSVGTADVIFSNQSKIVNTSTQNILKSAASGRFSIVQ